MLYCSVNLHPPQKKLPRAPAFNEYFNPLIIVLVYLHSYKNIEVEVSPKIRTTY